MVLTRVELWVLRAVEQRPGAGQQQLVASATLDPDALGVALESLHRDGLVRRTMIERTGAIAYRVTRAGVEQLISTPPPRRRAPKQAFGQLTVFHGLAER